jgi:hypothetical protein
MVKHGLRNIVRERIIGALQEVKPNSGWKVLIVDQTALRVLGAACRTSEITEEGVTHIEKLELARQPIPDMEAIYLISPTPESIRHLVSDWKPAPPPDKPILDKKKKKGKSQENQLPADTTMYANAHVYLTSHLSDEGLFSIKNCPGLLKKMRYVKLGRPHTRAPQMLPLRTCTPASHTSDRTERTAPAHHILPSYTGLYWAAGRCKHHDDTMRQ